MNEIITVRDSDIVAAEINTIKEDTRRIMIANAIRIGGKLVEAKSMVDHGQWGKWLEEKVNYSQSTANNMMQLYREYGTNQESLFDNWTNSETFAKLSYTQHMALLALPFTDRLDFAEQNDVENMSTRELEKAIREELAAAERERDELREENAGLTAQLDAAGEKLLEAERLTHAQQDAAQMARDEVNRLNDELEKARKQAERKEKEAEKARNQLESAQKNEKSVREQLEQLKTAPKIPAATMQKLRLEAEQEAARKSENELKKQMEKAEAELAEAVKRAQMLEEELSSARRTAKMSDPIITETIVRAQKLQNDFNELNGLRLKQLAAGTEDAVKTAGTMRKIMSDMVEQMLHIVGK